MELPGVELTNQRIFSHARILYSLRLTTLEAQQIVRLLGGPEFDFLGLWRSDVAKLREINQKLIRGVRPAIIDDFFAPATAQVLYDEFMLLHDLGQLKVKQGEATPFAATGVDSEAYRRAHLPGARCSMLRKQKYYYHHHGVGSFKDHGYPQAEVPTMVRLWEVMTTSKEWFTALNLLVSGSGYRLKAGKDKTGGSVLSGLKPQGPYFREFQPGDFELSHNDCVNNRVLSLTGWMSTPGWQADWGGTNLWCGIPSQADAPGSPIVFEDAHRFEPSFNRAALLLPHLGATHMVEPVSFNTPSTHHRFSWTFWSTVQGYSADSQAFDADKHWKTQMNKIGYQLDGQEVQISK
jgi:hypothetical protein